jgi:transposase-like protein
VKLVIEGSRPIAAVARELGIGDGTLRNWAAAYRRKHAGDEPGLIVSERERLRQLEREARELRMENEFLKKGRGVLRPGSSVSDTFEFIDAEYAASAQNDNREAPSIVRMCAWTGVSRSGYYEWRKRPESATARRRDELKQLIEHFFDPSDGTYGYRRIHAGLAEHGVDCGPELVRALMREVGLQPASRGPGLTVAGDAQHHIPDLVARDFSADGPGEETIPSSRATCAIGRDASITALTASSREPGPRQSR